MLDGRVCGVHVPGRHWAAVVECGMQTGTRRMKASMTKHFHMGDSQDDVTTLLMCA